MKSSKNAVPERTARKPAEDRENSKSAILDPQEKETHFYKKTGSRKRTEAGYLDEEAGEELQQEKRQRRSPSQENI